MAEEPDQLRRDIEYTRASLTRDVDALADKTSPKRVAQRRWTSVKEKVMGTPRHAGDSFSDKASSAAGTVQDKASSAASTVQEKASSAAGTVQEKPHTVAEQTRGNPLAAGIIAFGAGLLAASLIPVTDAERRAGQQIKDNSGELTDKVKDAAGELKDDLSGTVQEAAQQVKSTAQDAAQQTKQQAQSSAQDATQQTKQAAQEVR
jgi:vacuolar-type H+-ATPase subunit H